MNGKIAICLVSYYPDKDLLERIEFTLQDGYSVFVYDNTPSDTSFFSALSMPNFTLLANGKNEGMGVALNVLLKFVKELGFSRALYFDQDTVFTLGSLRWIDEYLAKDCEIADVNWGALNFLPNKKMGLTQKHVTLMVNAGTLFNLGVIEQIGYHNVRWFLECVDYEWCGRALNKGFNLLQVGGCPGLDHEINQPNDRRKFWGKHYHIRIYPISRTLNFTRGLCLLGIWGFVVGEWKFGLSCFRNTLTHIVNQGFSGMLWAFAKKD